MYTFIYFFIKAQIIGPHRNSSKIIAIQTLFSVIKYPSSGEVNLKIQPGMVEYIPHSLELHGRLVELSGGKSQHLAHAMNSDVVLLLPIELEAEAHTYKKK